MKTSYIARIHPAISFGYFIAAIVMTMTQQHPVYLSASVLGALLLNISIFGMGIWKKMVLLLPVPVLVAAINPLFNTQGQNLLFSLFGRPYTLEALLYGLVVGGMLLGMLLWFTAYNAVLTDDKLSFLFSAFSPSLSLLLTTAFRMIPDLIRRLRQIMDARKCIGKAGGRSVKEKLNSGATAVSILTGWALEGSVTTADSMNSRGYGTGRRSSFHTYRFAAADAALAVVLTLLWLIMLLGAVTGKTAAAFIPTPVIAPVQPLTLAAYLAFLMIPTVLNWKEDIRWYILRSGI